MPIEITALEGDSRHPEVFRMLVTVISQEVLTEEVFRSLVEESVGRIVDETVRATMLKYRDEMAKLLTGASLRDSVIQKLQAHVRNM